MEERTWSKHARPTGGFAGRRLSPGCSLYNMRIFGSCCKLPALGELSQGTMSFVRAEVSLCQVSGNWIQNFSCLRSHDLGFQTWCEEGRRGVSLKCLGGTLEDEDTRLRESQGGGLTVGHTKPQRTSADDLDSLLLTGEKVCWECD